METFLGTSDTGAFIASFAFALIGMVISLLLAGANRTPTNSTTPYKFDIGFLIADNWKRILLNLLLIFVAVRFYPDVFNVPINPFLALGVGLGFDKLAELIKNKTGFLTVDRSKIVEPEKTKPPLNDSKSINIH